MSQVATKASLKKSSKVSQKITFSKANLKELDEETGDGNGFA